jgi:hypothetical protein
MRVFCVHTNQGQKKREKKRRKNKKDGRECRARVDLIWDDGERREKEGRKKKRLRGEGRRGLTRTRIEPCLKEKKKENK